MEIKIYSVFTIMYDFGCSNITNSLDLMHVTINVNMTNVTLTWNVTPINKAEIKHTFTRFSPTYISFVYNYYIKQSYYIIVSPFLNKNPLIWAPGGICAQYQWHQQRRSDFCCRYIGIPVRVYVRLKQNVSLFTLTTSLLVSPSSRMIKK